MDLNEQKGKPKCLSHSLQTKVLLQIYDLETLEIGTNIKGTSCLSRDDLTKAHGNNVQLLYGEILPSGIRKLFDKEHLDASKYKVFYDMGCGVGKLTIQCFLEYKNLKKVVGVEFSRGRYQIASNALRKLCGAYPQRYSITEGDSWIRLTEKKKRKVEGRRQWTSEAKRTLEFREQNMFDVDLSDAELLFCDTELHESQYQAFLKVLSSVQDHTRLASYKNLHEITAKLKVETSWEQLEINKSTDDRFFTTWATQRGHHFFLYEKLKKEKESLL